MQVSASQSSRPAIPVAWRGVAVYLALAYGLSWTAQVGMAMLAMSNPEVGAALGGGIIVLAALLMWPPAVGAYVARRWVERSGFADSGLRWPSPRFVLLAWFGPIVLTLITMLVSLPIYPFDAELSVMRQMLARAPQPPPMSPEMIVAIQVLTALTVAVPINSIFAFGEEFGWRGYLMPRLMSLLGTWPGLIAHGAIWGFWHAPLIYLIGYNYPGHNLIGVPLFVVAGILMGVLLGWLQIASRSVVPPTIAHAAFNAVGPLPLILLRGVDPAVAGVLYSPVGFVVMAAVILWLIRAGAFASRPRAPLGAI